VVLSGGFRVTGLDPAMSLQVRQIPYYGMDIGLLQLDYTGLNGKETSAQKIYTNPTKQ
jgi:hypothetical protein